MMDGDKFDRISQVICDLFANEGLSPEEGEFILAQTLAISLGCRDAPLDSYMPQMAQAWKFAVEDNGN